MNELRSFLNHPLFQIGDVSMTMAQLLLLPLGIALSLLVTRWIVGGLARRMLARGHNANLVQMATRGIWVLTIITLFMATLGLLNVPFTAFAFLSGAIAIGLGFGAQNIINYFISGWILIGEAPIRIDDLLEINS
jgi:small-conductance mechanosensitive channel